MKSHASLTVFLLFLLVTQSCGSKTEDAQLCNEIQLNKPFTAKLGEDWCIPQTGWKINFGSVVDDSRCNVPDIDCIWAGMFVMSATIDNGEITQDTFYAINNWQDTIFSGPYAIHLNLVKPEIRATTEPLDPSAYSFEMLVK